jgi:hypothetical protein
MDKQRLEEIKLSASLYQQTTSDQGVRLMMDALFEVIEAYEQATTWRPISEATEYMRGIDYCLLLLPWEDYNPHMVVGWFNGGWFCKHPRGGYDCYVEPTHFLPLPKPPVTEGE